MDKQPKDLSIYNKKFHEDPSSFNEFQAMDYVKELKNQGKDTEAIEVGRTFMEVAPEYTRYINHYGYALYNKYINIDNEDILKNEGLFYSILDEIIDVCKQERFSPVEAAINRAIKFVNSQSPIDYERLSSLLDDLDPTLLNDQPFVNKEGREFESKKEKWYRLKVRALFNIKDYKNCLEQANIALALPLKWHVQNKQWIQYYRAKSLVELERYDEAEQAFMSISRRFRGADLNDVLCELYLNNGKEKEAYTTIIYNFFRNGLDASQLKNYKNIVTMTKQVNALKAEQLATALVLTFDENFETDTNLDDVKELSQDDLFDKLYAEIMEHLENYIDRHEGKVVYYNQDKEFGSIDFEIEDNDRLFFRQADYIYDEIVQRFDVVEFSVMKNYDNRNNKTVYRAILLKMLYEDNNY